MLSGIYSAYLEVSPTYQSLILLYSGFVIVVTLVNIVALVMNLALKVHIKLITRKLQRANELSEKN